MKKKILNTILIMEVLTLTGFYLSACNHKLDIQQAYPFTVETMPVQKHIVKGQNTRLAGVVSRIDLEERGGSRALERSQVYIFPDPYPFFRKA